MDLFLLMVCKHDGNSPFPLLSLGYQCQSFRQQQGESDRLEKSGTNATIHEKLLISGYVFPWNIFNRPQLTPTGVWNERSLIRCTATEHNSFIPRAIKGWLRCLRGGKQGNMDFIKHLTDQSGGIGRKRCGGNPNIPDVLFLSRQQRSCHQFSNRAMGTQKKKTFLFLTHRIMAP